MLFGEQNDLWRVNAEDDYHEEVRGAQATEIVEDALSRAFPRLDPTAFGAAVGLASGALLFLMTLILVLKDGPVVGPTLGLLSQFFPFYDVTPIGSLLGLFYGFVFGFLVGWGAAALRNLIVVLSLEAIERRQRLQLLWKALY
jgi:hypothetical protein